MILDMWAHLSDSDWLAVGLCLVMGMALAYAEMAGR